MKINLLQELKTLEGETLNVMREGKGLEPMTLKNPCINSLMGVYDDEKNLSGEDKVKRYDLATKIQSFSELEATPEEVSLIRKLVAKAYSPLVVGQVWKMLA